MKKSRIQWNTTEQKLPNAITKQLSLRQQYKYLYKKQSNGDIYNNNILYIKTGIAHVHQLQSSFDKVIKQLAVICHININLVQRHTGEYLGYAFVYVSNPAVYYALLGKNLDGTERIEYINVPQEIIKNDSTFSVQSTSWADIADEITSNTKIKTHLPPLAILEPYIHDEQQISHTQQTEGIFECFPAFVKEYEDDPLENCKLYVSELPNMPDKSLEYLYELFAPYAVTVSEKENKKIHFPRIEIRTSDTFCYAIVTYAHAYDAAFALLMLQKMRIKYNDIVKIVTTKYAFNK